MKRWALLLVPLAASCAARPYFYGDEFSQYYMRPAEETRQELLESREIVHWKNDPKQKQRVGYLFHVNTQVKGSRVERDSWYIYDRWGTSRVGFITSEGVFYRFDERGQLGEEVGRWTIITTGLKAFLGIDLRDNLDLDPIDPYK